LVKNKSCFTVNNSQKLSVLLTMFFKEKENRFAAGNKALNYVVEKTGATTKIINYLEK